MGAHPFVGRLWLVCLYCGAPMRSTFVHGLS